MNLTTSIREQVCKWGPLDDLLPDHLPAFIRSPAYFFSVITLGSLVLLILSGILLAAFGPQWVVMNETGNYPGAAWLWLYTFWYQVPPYNTLTNADALVLLTMGILTAIFVLFPFLPYANRLPYYLRVHRLIWHEYYHDVRAEEQRKKGASPDLGAKIPIIDDSIEA